MPALQTLLLFSGQLDTNHSCTRIVADQWLEVVVSDPQQAADMVTSTIRLRNAWVMLLNVRIKAHVEKEGDEGEGMSQKLLLLLICEPLKFYCVCEVCCK